jgi:hypothetical protein
MAGGNEYGLWATPGPMIQETAMHENHSRARPLSLVSDLSPVSDRQSRNRGCTHQSPFRGPGRASTMRMGLAVVMTSASSKPARSKSVLS